MKSKRSFVALVSLTLLLLISSSARAADWDPQRTWVFAVGLVQWKDKDSFDSFPAENRKDTVLINTFKKRGVPASQIVYLQDRAATTAVVQAKFVDFLKRPAPGDWIFVYFEGHGYKTDDTDTPYLVTYDVDNKKNLGWKFRSIPDNIEKYFRGDYAIIALDNCYSGSMAGAVRAVKRRVSYAVLASSMASQESTGNWTYTEAIINGLSGLSFTDHNHDGSVTLGELAKNAEDDMLFGEEQVATTAFTRGFDPNTMIAIAKPAASSRIGNRVEAFSDNDWWRGYIIADKGSKVLVHYYGYEQEDEEWVANKYIRVPRSDSPFRVGQKVEVSYNHEWYPAHIVNIKGRSHCVSYDDYDTDENEWVPASRIRKRGDQR